MRRATSPVDATRAESLRRARNTVEVARRAVQSAEPFEGSVDPILCHLYVHSIRWALQGLASACFRYSAGIRTLN